MSQEIEKIIRRINRAWQEGHPGEMEELLHPEVVMVFPEFSGRSQGADAMLAGFRDFCTNATVLEYHESDLEIDVINSTAVATFTFTMLYERDGSRYQSAGRDLWIFARQDDRWLATWRTMLDVVEEEV